MAPPAPAAGSQQRSPARSRATRRLVSIPVAVLGLLLAAAAGGWLTLPSSVPVRLHHTWARLTLWRSAVFGYTFATTGQVGDGREARAVAHALAAAQPGSAGALIDALDAFSRDDTCLPVLGREKLAILEAAAANCTPSTVLTVGSYLGYGTAFLADRLPPGGRLFAADASSANGAAARQLLAHAGLQQRVQFVQGGVAEAAKALQQQGARHVDLVLFDQDPDSYEQDLATLVSSGLLRRGSLVAANKVVLPGAHNYRKVLNSSAPLGASFETHEHRAESEFASFVLDIVLVSRYSG